MNHKIASAMVLFLSMSACTESESMDDEAAESGESGAEEVSPLRCADTDLTPVAPFAGPGYDPEAGGLLGTPQASYVAATTLFNYRTDEATLERFYETVENVIEQAEGSEGFIGYELAYSEGCNLARTITVWKDMDSMMGFVLSDAHAQAMTQAGELGYDGRTIDWEATADDLPISWSQARARLVPVLP